jgi:Outer membrane lipoprotein-sorting protein
MNKFIGLALLAALAAYASSPVPDAAKLVQEAQARIHSASERYEGTLDVFNAKKKIATRHWLYQRLGPYGNSKAIFRFTSPQEVKNVALLVESHPSGSADLWIWIPSEERDRHVAVQNLSTRFFGTDFSFEDLEDPVLDHFDYVLLGEEELGDAGCWKVESRPKKTNYSQYTSTILWIRKDNYVISQIDHLREDKLVRRITHSDIHLVSNIWTAHTIEAFDAKRNSRTVLKLSNVEYNVNLNERDFTRAAFPSAR